MKNVAQRKAVLLGKRDIQPVVGCGGLQFKVERTAEALAERESPSFIDTSAERRVDDQLHSAALIEETFGDDGLLRRHFTQYGAPSNNVFHRLLGARIVKAALFFQPRNCTLDLGTRFQSAQAV